MTKLQERYDKFASVYKRILKSKLSRNREKLIEYRAQILEAYDIFLTFILKYYEQSGDDIRAAFDEKLKRARVKLVECLDTLGCDYSLPEDLYDRIENEQVGEVQFDKIKSQLGSTGSLSTNSETVERRNSTESNASTESNVTENVQTNLEGEGTSKELEKKRLEEEKRKKEEEERRRKEERDKLKEEERIRKIKMSMKEQKELLEMVNNQIRKPYEGDPLGLATFISSLQILETFATSEELKSKLVIFVKARLEGRARELVTDEETTVEALIQKLRATIKPENSKIIEARISALHYSYAKQEEFASRAEELADALRRTLIIEGMTPDKANEVTIDKTVQLCRKSTHSDVVKAVLEATQFKTAKEVVAKLITSSDTCVKEKQILRYQRENRGAANRGKFNRNRNFQNHNNRGRNWNNFANNNFVRNNQDGYRNNNRGRGGYRGRGGFGGRPTQGGGRYQAPRNSDNQANWRVDNRNVRLTQSGNASVPQATMGGPARRIDE